MVCALTNPSILNVFSPSSASYAEYSRAMWAAGIYIVLIVERCYAPAIRLRGIKRHANTLGQPVRARVCPEITVEGSILLHDDDHMLDRRHILLLRQFVRPGGWRDPELRRQPMPPRPGRPSSSNFASNGLSRCRESYPNYAADASNWTIEARHKALSGRPPASLMSALHASAPLPCRRTVRSRCCPSAQSCSTARLPPWSPTASNQPVPTSR